MFAVFGPLLLESRPKRPEIKKTTARHKRPVDVIYGVHRIDHSGGREQPGRSPSLRLPVSPGEPHSILKNVRPTPALCRPTRSRRPVCRLRGRQPLALAEGGGGGGGGGLLCRTDPVSIAAAYPSSLPSPPGRVTTPGSLVGLAGWRSTPRDSIFLKKDAHCPAELWHDIIDPMMKSPPFFKLLQKSISASCDSGAWEERKIEGLHNFVWVDPDASRRSRYLRT